jgi:hypothetical protein
MKTLTGMLVVALMSSAALAAECPDFSGRYNNTELGMNLVLTITQFGCERAKVVYDYGKYHQDHRPMIFDGEKRVRFDVDTLLTLESYRFESRAIVIETVSYMKKVDKKTSSRGNLFFDPAGNLVEETLFLGEDGQESGKNTLVYARY